MTTEFLFNKIAEKQRATILATPNPSCPLCVGKKSHIGQPMELAQRYHPWRGHGISSGQPCYCNNPACPYAMNNLQKTIGVKNEVR